MDKEEKGNNGNGLAGFNKRRAEGKDYDAKKKNLQHKNPELNPINTICYLQILGTGMDTQDTSPSVLLFFDKQRFIFNAGEGLQRFCTEHKVKLSKIDHMFLTRVCSETAGGLPGLLLTLAGIGEEGMSINVWGPSDLNYLVDAMKSFIPHATMVHTNSFGETQSNSKIVLIDDKVVQITAMLLKPAQAAGSSVKPGDISVVYACELTEIKGKFDPVKAAALGLKRGQKYRQLQLGNIVDSDLLDIKVKPEDVLGPSLPGPIVLIVDCPTEQHMLELFSLKFLNCYYADSSNCDGEGAKSVNCIIHMGPASVTNSIDYQKWMKKFGSTQHIMAGHEKKNMESPILNASSRISSRLNYLCPHLFPAHGLSSPMNSNFAPQVNGSNEDLSLTTCENISAENLLKFHLRPVAQLGLDRSAVPISQSYKKIVDELISEIPEITNISKCVKNFWDAEQIPSVTNGNEKRVMVEEPWINEASSTNADHTGKNDNEAKKHINGKFDIPPCLDNITREDMEIVLLGTGSSQPSKYRNVSSIFIDLFDKGSVLLDCGEGTFGQLKRRFGIEGADNAVKKLKCIWISHIHADHHTGLARILAVRSKLLKNIPHEPILVIGPRQLNKFLDAYSRLEDLDMQFLDCRHTVENDVSQPSESSLFSGRTKMESHWKRPANPIDTASALPLLMKLKTELNNAGVEALTSVPVIHCPQAFGVVLKAKERLNSTGKTIPGWKLVYSGDTRPCQSLINASTDATVLIHEATFEDGMEEEAITKNHSTTGEAINVGALAGAYRIILTHFSQRYPKIPVFDEAHMDRTCIAFDLMSINAADLHVLPEVVPYLKVLFKNEMAVDEPEELMQVGVH